LAARSAASRKDADAQVRVRGISADDTYSFEAREKLRQLSG
jgi:hypothetical protein